MCLTSLRTSCAPGRFQLWWWLGGLTLDDEGHPEPAAGAVKVAESFDPIGLCDQSPSWAEWALIEYGTGILALVNSAGEVLALERAGNSFADRVAMERIVVGNITDILHN